LCQAARFRGGQSCVPTQFDWAIILSSKVRYDPGGLPVGLFEDEAMRSISLLPLDKKAFKKSMSSRGNGSVTDNLEGMVTPVVHGRARALPAALFDRQSHPTVKRRWWCDWMHVAGWRPERLIAWTRSGLRLLTSLA